MEWTRGWAQRPRLNYQDKWFKSSLWTLHARTKAQSIFWKNSQGELRRAQAFKSLTWRPGLFKPKLRLFSIPSLDEKQKFFCISPWHENFPLECHWCHEGLFKKVLFSICSRGCLFENFSHHLEFRNSFYVKKIALYILILCLLTFSRLKTIEAWMLNANAFWWHWIGN